MEDIAFFASKAALALTALSAHFLANASSS
jgi:hypothetical protein